MWTSYSIEFINCETIVNTESEFSVILVIIVLGKDFLQSLPFDDIIQYTLFYLDPYFQQVIIFFVI